MLQLPVKEGMGIGSLPFTDPEESLALIETHLSSFPHWPQQPSLGEGARIVSQFTYPLVKLGLIQFKGERQYFCNHVPDWDRRLTAFYQLYLDIEAGDMDLLEEYFALPRRFFPGFYLFLQKEWKDCISVKGQVSGPLTVGLQVKDAEGRDSFYDTALRDIIQKTIALEAQWQIERLKPLDVPVLISIDDPGIYACGSSAYISIGREEVTDTLLFLSTCIQTAGASAGLHSCAGIDWSLPLQSNLSVLSFDAYGYFHTLIGYVPQINEFLSAGGILAWGLVPTTQEAFHETAVSLFRRLEEHQHTLIRRGVQGERVKNQLLITPSCGCGTLEGPLAERIYALTEELVVYYQNNR